MGSNLQNRRLVNLGGYDDERTGLAHHHSELVTALHRKDDDATRIIVRGCGIILPF
jgi:hypothetical protein